MNRAKPLNERVWKSVSLVLVLYVVVLYVPQIIMGAFDVAAPTSDLINLAIYSGFWFFVVPFVLKIPRRVGVLGDYLRDIQLVNTKPLGRLITLGVATGGLYLLMMVVSSLLIGWYAPNVQSILPPENWILLYGNVGAFFEEVAIRGVILILLLRRYARVTAVLLSALLFGVGHIITFFLGNELFFSLVQVVYASCLGILFAALVLKTNSLLPGIIAHMMINSFSGILGNSLEVSEMAILLLITSMLTTVLGLLALKYVPNAIGGENRRWRNHRPAEAVETIR